MESNKINWDDILVDHRGVELSQDGEVIQCPNCFKWDALPIKRKGVYDIKVCAHCSHNYKVENALNKDIIVKETKESENLKYFIKGEYVNRYHISKYDYIDISKDGINYKEANYYNGDKIVVRKTGVGIYATIDKNNSYTPQVVFIFKPKEDISEEFKNYSLEYFLGILNSRLMLYYYYKKTGQTEWKSFPYITQDRVKQFPIKKIDFTNPNEKELHNKITNLVKRMIGVNSIDKDIDYEIESLVMNLYNITPDMKTQIWNELKSVQKLRIIKEIFD